MLWSSSYLLLALAFFPLRPSLAVDYVPSSWMAALPDSTKLTELSIIGTHNSLSFDAKGQKVSMPSRTQYFSLSQQLDAGARFIDVRMRHFKDELLAHHGREYLHQDFCDVMMDLCAFLKGPSGQTEVVVMRLRRERPKDKHARNTRTWAETLDFYFTQSRCAPCIKSIYKSPQPDFSWPSLGQARGKVLFIEDFSAPEGQWISYGPTWRDEEVMLVQDRWKVISLSARGSKLKFVQNFFTEHIDTSSGNLLPRFENKLLLNHLSGASPFAWPAQVARGITGLNNRLEKWLCTKEDGKRIAQLGVLIVDFIEEGNLADIVIGRNFGKTC